MKQATSVRHENSHPKNASSVPGKAYQNQNLIPATWGGEKQAEMMQMFSVATHAYSWFESGE